MSFAAAATDDSAFRPAAGGTLIDDAIDARIAGEPLDAEAEAALIAMQWR